MDFQTAQWLTEEHRSDICADIYDTLHSSVAGGATKSFKPLNGYGLFSRLFGFPGDVSELGSSSEADEMGE